MDGVRDASAIPAIAHYRDAAADPDRSCGTCSYFGAGSNFHCGMWDVAVSPEKTCDEWAEGLPGALPTQWQWDDLDAVSPPLAAAAPGMTSLSTMICVKPRLEEAEALAASPTSDPAESLHVTLAYLGDYEGDLDQVADALRLVAGEHAALEGTIAGYGTFAPADDDPWPVILLPDVPGLVELRVAVTEALVAADVDYSRSHGFLAHVTLEYAPGPLMPEDGQAGLPVHFDELLIVRSDDEVVALPLTGAMPLTAAAGETFCLPDELRGVTDPIRQAFVQAVMTPGLREAGLSWDLSNPLASDVISRAGQHIVGISQTTQDDVMNVISYAHDQGLSIPDTAKAIRSHMAEAANGRATTIARTEMAAAVNGGSLAATKIALQASGGGGQKTWMTAPGATYPRHEDYDDLDGQTVSLNDFFQVGDSQLQYPGDPDGDAGEVINCRCSMTYKGGSDDLAGENMDAAGAKKVDWKTHNERLLAGHRRIDELEPKLARALEPIFVRAGDVAARNFERFATNHLTAAGDWTPPAGEEILPVNCGEASGGVPIAPPSGPSPKELGDALQSINQEVRGEEDRRDYVPMAKAALKQMSDQGYLANAQRVEAYGSWVATDVPAPGDVDLLVTVDSLTDQQRELMDAVTKTGGDAAHPFGPDFHVVFVSPTDPVYNEEFAAKLRAGTERRHDVQPRILWEHPNAPKIPATSSTATMRSPEQAVQNQTSQLDANSKADVDDALASIGSYVNAPGAPTDAPAVTAKVVGNLTHDGQPVLGLFDPHEMTIDVRRLANDRYATFTHEYGHALDSMIANHELEFYATASPAGYGLDAWKSAVEGTETYDKILTALNEAVTVARATPAGGLTGSSIIYVGDQAYTAKDLLYALDDQELFARAFVQWMSERDDRLAAHVEEELGRERQSVGSWYWGSEEFAPVAAAMSDFFRSRGLLAE